MMRESLSRMLWLHLVQTIGALIPYSSFNSQNVFLPSCSSMDAYKKFDPTMVTSAGCNACPQYSNSTCVCSSGYYESACDKAACPVGQIRSFDGTFCIGCPNGIINVTISGTTTYTTVCNCPANNYYGIFISY